MFERPEYVTTTRVEHDVKVCLTIAMTIFLLAVGKYQDYIDMYFLRGHCTCTNFMTARWSVRDEEINNIA